MKRIYFNTNFIWVRPINLDFISRQLWPRLMYFAVRPLFRVFFRDESST